MRNLLPYALLAIVLSGCSSLPTFRNATEVDFGYKIKDGDRKDIFDVRVFLPEAVNPEFRIDYMNRAAGEECLTRGFVFWDTGLINLQSLRAYCFKRQTRKSLGILMSTKNPKILLIEDTLPNSYAPFRPNDVVKKIGGVEVDSIGAFKEQILKLSESGRREVTVLVERSGIAISLEARFTEQKDALYSPETLEALRKKTP